MTVHFFVGSEFSNNTDFNALNSVSDSITFYPAGYNNLDAIASDFKPNDIIIGASAGGSSAAELYKKVSELKPTFIGFEAFGTKEIDNAITIVQATNPKKINYPNHFMFEIQDDNLVKDKANKDRYVYGHAFYSIHPHFLSLLNYESNDIQRINNSEYVTISKASLQVNNQTYTYTNLVAKTTDTNSTQLDTSLNARVFALDLISGIATLAAERNLDKQTNLPNDLKFTLKNTPKESLVDSPMPIPSPLTSATDIPFVNNSALNSETLQWKKIHDFVDNLRLDIANGKGRWISGSWGNKVNRLNTLKNWLNDKKPQSEETLGNALALLHCICKEKRFGIFTPTSVFEFQKFINNENNKELHQAYKASRWNGKLDVNNIEEILTKFTPN